MAGFFETLLSYQSPSSVFGDATTVPSIVSTSNDNINYLRDSVNQSKSDLVAAQKGYNSLLATQPQQYNYPSWLVDALNDNYTNYKSGINNLESLVNPAYDTWKSQLSTQQTRINDAQAALQKNQTALQNAIASQKGQIAAGQDAVNWGLAAKNAELNGLNNAQQMYSNLMAQWANNFAGTPIAQGGGSNGKL